MAPGLRQENEDGFRFRVDPPAATAAGTANPWSVWAMPVPFAYSSTVAVSTRVVAQPFVLGNEPDV